MILKEKKVMFKDVMNQSMYFMPSEQFLLKFKRVVSAYIRNLEFFSKCDIDNDKDFYNILITLYKMTFLTDDFLTIISDKKRILFNRLNRIMTNMVFEYENSTKAKNKITYGHLCLNVAVASDYNLNLKTIYTAARLRTLEKENKIVLYSKVINLYDSVPVAKPVVIDDISQISSMDLFDKLKDRQVLTQQFGEVIEKSDLYDIFMEFLRVMFPKRKVLNDMKLYSAAFMEQFEKFMNQDDEIVTDCKKWYDKSIQSMILQKVNNH